MHKQDDTTFAIVVPHEGGLAVVLDAPTIQRLKLSAGSALKLASKGTSVTLTPVRQEVNDSEFNQATAHLHKKYGKALKKLAE